MYNTSAAFNRLTLNTIHSSKECRVYSRKRKQDEAKPVCINGSPCVGRIWCWKELNYCITMSDRGIWGLSALSLRLHSYQLQCSPPIGCAHDEASRQASLFTTIWLTFRHAQKRRICQIHLWLCQLLSTCGNICFAPPPTPCLLASSMHHSPTSLHVSKFQDVAKCRHERLVTLACRRRSKGLTAQKCRHGSEPDDEQASDFFLFFITTRPQNH